MPARAHTKCRQKASLFRLRDPEQGALNVSNEHWEIRRALRYGSERIKVVCGLEAAKAHADDDIVANGNVGRIEFIDRDKRILYYDIYPEMT